jgi:uncharacterized protein (TIGR02001 family)
MKQLAVITAMLISLQALAQEEDKQGKIDFSIGGDVVSSFVWRGMQLSNASFQPEMELSVGNFFIGAWGSVDFQGLYKEVDLFAGYSFGNLSLMITDYWTPLNPGDYFDFSEATPHLLEAGLSYTFNSFPLTLGWNTIFAGIEDFPTYVEASYDFSVKETELSVAIGASPWSSNAMYETETEGFAFINASLTATKELKITENFSLPVFAQLSVNPTNKDAFFVLGIKF